MDRLRALAARVQRRLGDRPLPAPAPAGLAAAEPDRRRGRAARARLQHSGELRHEHELAELRRRVDDEPSHADGRPDGAELRLGGRRDRGRRRAHPRIRAPPLRHDRKLLGRPDADDDARAAAALNRLRAHPRQPGRNPVAPWAGHRDHRRRGHPVDLSRAGREPGGDQGARHERRRDRQRELGAPVREPERLHGHPRDPRPALDSLRAHVRIRPARRQPAAGLGASSARCSCSGSDPRASRCISRPTATRGWPRRASVRSSGTWRARRSASAPRPAACSQPRRRAPRRARSTPPTTASRRSAAPCRS